MKLKHPEKIVVSCPDVMFNVYPREIPDDKYTGLAQKWEVKKWVDSDGRVRWYGCRRGHSHTNSGSCSFNTGLGVPPCDLENLADAIKFVMKECEDAGLFCELQEGTLLGNYGYTNVHVQTTSSFTDRGTFSYFILSWSFDSVTALPSNVS